MAKVYLESTDTSFIVNNSNTVVYGANGAQTITVASGVTNVIADQNVEKVVFSGATNDYTYAQIGNQMGVYKDGTLVTTIPLQGDSDGTQFQFSNGTTNAMLTSGVMTIGGGSVSSTPTSVTMTDTAITKTTTTTTTPTTPADTGGGGGGDTTAPTLSSSTPTDNATAVAIGANIVLTLNETVTAVTGKNIYIKTTTGDTTVATIDAASSQVTISGGVVTINPTADLSASTEYYVLVESGAFKDAANNVYTGISSTTALSFTTATPTPAITYSGTTFAEAAANDGSITANVTLTLANDTFTGTNGNALTGAVVTNVPTGLTAVVTKTSDTVATVTFTGAATNHANANDIANLTITLGNTAFTGGSAAAVTNATKSDLVIDFADAPTPAITYSGTTFAEAAANDGSITANVTLTLANDTFTGINGNALTGAVVTNVPTGLTAVVTKTSDTVATVTFTGAATNHANANDIANLTITLGNTAFTGGSAAAVTNATKSDLVIDFADAPTPAITYSGTTFAEAAANDGSITANVTLTLANDTFTGINGNALTGAVVTNVPTGLTAVVTKTSDTVATVTFTGAATNHANANDIANLTITLGNTAFTGGSAAAVTNATKSDLVIDFADAPDTTPPTVSSFGITTTTVTATLTTDTGTIGLYTSGTTLATGVTAGTITNTTTGAVTAVAQSSVATVTAKVLDTANNEATNTQSVILGTTGSDAITETIFNQFIFGFGGADTFTLKDGNTGSVLPIIADYAVNTSGESIAFGGTAAAWTTAVTDWTITNGVATKTGATSSDFYTAFIAATGAAGEVVAFVDGGTFLFGEGASNADTDNTAVVLVGVQATAVATSAGATTVLIA